MQNEIKKVARIQLYDEPYDRAISDTGIVFYNLDINTAVIEMEIIRKNYPLQISDENVDTYVYLQGVDLNGNDYGTELDVEYLDPFSGLLSVTIPSDYLKAVNGSTVLAQLYITLHKNNRVPNTKSDTVVLNEFKFTVKDALINSVSGVTKIEKIREFDKMRDEIRKRMTDIETAMKNGSDYVIRMENTLTDGLKQINDLVAKAKKDINDTVVSAQSSLNTTKDNVVKNINDTTTKNIADSNKAKQDVLDAISNAKLINKDTFDSNNKDIAKAMTVLDTSNLNSAKAYIDSKQWQKYKLTNDDGTRKWLGTLSSPIESLEPGLYECTIPANANTVNAPLDVNNSSYIAELNVTKGSNGRKQIILIQNYTEDVWLKTIHTNGVDRGWTLINPKPNFTDTGWLPLTLTNNVQAYSTAYTPQYKLVNNNGDITLKLKGAVKNLTTTGVTIATLPSNIASLITMIAPFVQNSSFKNGNATTARWSVNMNGKIKLDGVSFSNTLMTADDFYPITTVIPL
ncbi:BppU family phage baseplate upper protein [Staphylococcus warneri]|uniref:BppU family phage baseplate upper protein n=1 Tax=Staphylococcus warneri TaxID=1292 RepID=UPI0018898439|nr:BppU family phage baseplate upper protein [Staphylococcus warneri]MBF2179170.1 BppU family phage baseplate upper protein [Staphylococcus warneri]MBF2181561.1 BppU family phage baseplate upper protein [Staphylococcus warneri]MBF2186133.1 BppU family phage baseplate upper protein [Staphylococcus warneri]MBF2263502.1 BppU family phage baseplate upper protein [Staphylococcus warneri]MBF2266218.1 BppU family phage baseplate upper protein [Staphylococcus warneri]